MKNSILKSLAIVGTIAITQVACKKESETTPSTAISTNNTKTCTQSKMSSVDGDSVKYYREYTRDGNGKILVSKKFSVDSLLIGESKYTRSSTGKTTKLLHTDLVNSANTYTHIMEYNSSDLLVKRTEDLNGTISIHNFTYTDTLLIKDETVDADGNFKRSYEYEYNASGIKIKDTYITTSNPDVNNYYRDYTLDSQDRLESWIEYNLLTKVKEGSYSKTYGTGVPRLNVHTYFKADGSLDKKQVFEYDVNDNKVRHYWERADGSKLFDYKYEYSCS